jgi:multidrug efflux pump subunit AcrA (membrane-fusion protein)
MTDDEALEAIRTAYQNATPERREFLDQYFESLKPFVDRIAELEAQVAKLTAERDVARQAFVDRERVLDLRREEVSRLTARAEAAEAALKAEAARRLALFAVWDTVDGDLPEWQYDENFRRFCTAMDEFRASAASNNHPEVA